MGWRERAVARLLARIEVSEIEAALRERFSRERPFFLEHGIHVMVAQTSDGALILGRSHQYGADPPPFDREDVFEAILSYACGLLCAHSFAVAERWQGVYARIEGKSEWGCEAEPGVVIVNGLSAGMTFAWGLAEELPSGC